MSPIDCDSSCYELAIKDKPRLDKLPRVFHSVDPMLPTSMKVASRRDGSRTSLPEVHLEGMTTTDCEKDFPFRKT